MHGSMRICLNSMHLILFLIYLYTECIAMPLKEVGGEKVE
jgi:hypothetical protein